MKTYYYFLLAGLLLPGVLKSQDVIEKEYNTKYELSIVLDDIFARNAVFNSPMYLAASSFYPYYIDYSAVDLTIPSVGFGFKYHLGKSAVRTKVSYGSDSYKKDQPVNNSREERNYYKAMLFMGYEFHHDIAKAQLFYGIDVYANLRNRTSEYENYSVDYPNTNENSESYKGFGISPLIGGKYRFNQLLSLSTELKFSVEKYSSETSYKSSSSETDDTSEVNGYLTKFGPLGEISLNFSF